MIKIGDKIIIRKESFLKEGLTGRIEKVRDDGKFDIVLDSPKKHPPRWSGIDANNFQIVCVENRKKDKR
jgi:hypothetical protein